MHLRNVNFTGKNVISSILHIIEYKINKHDENWAKKWILYVILFLIVCNIKCLIFYFINENGMNQNFLFRYRYIQPKFNFCLFLNVNFVLHDLRFFPKKNLKLLTQKS